MMLEPADHTVSSTAIEILFKPRVLRFSRDKSNKVEMYLHRQSYYTLLYCASQIMAFFFLHKLKVCGNPASSKSIGTIFPTGLAYFISLSHSGISYEMLSSPLVK